MAKTVLTNLNLNQNELQNVVLHPLAAPPTSPALGQLYYDTYNKLVYQYNGKTWVAVGGVVDTAISDTSTNAVQNKVVKAYVDSAIAASDAMIFKGTLGTGGTITALPTTYRTGWTYRVITAGTYAGNKCEIGDLIIALVDRSGTGNVNTDWTVAQTNIDGAITNVTGTAPITVTGSGASRTISHANSGVAINSYGQQNPATPKFGQSFAIPYFTVNSTGHITYASGAAVTIPNTLASLTDPGLMSADDKRSVQMMSSGIFIDTGTIAAGSTSHNIRPPMIPGTATSVKAVGVRLYELSTSTPSGSYETEVVADVEIDGKSNITVSFAKATTTPISYIAEFVKTR